MSAAALALGTVAATLVAKAAERAAEKSVDGLSKAAGGAFGALWDWLVRRFGKSEELAAGVEHPDDPLHRQALAVLIAKAIADQPDAQAELESLTAAAQAGQPQGGVHMSITGDGNVQMSNSLYNDLRRP